MGCRSLIFFRAWQVGMAGEGSITVAALLAGEGGVKAEGEQVG